MSVREILERALDTLDVDDVVDDWDARKMLETAVREALATLYAETVREILSGGERTISPGGGMEQRPDWRPYLQESSAGLSPRVEALEAGLREIECWAPNWAQGVDENIDAIREHARALLEQKP